MARASGFEWKVWGLLLAGGVIGVLAMLPMAMEMVAHMELPGSNPPLPMWLIALLSVGQNCVLLGLAIAGGLAWCRKLGLPGPALLSRWLRGERVNIRLAALAALAGGLGAGTLMVLFDALLFARHLPPAMLALLEIPVWKRLLAGLLYGGITEELLMRLCLVPLVLLLLLWMSRTAPQKMRESLPLVAVLLVAVLFGLGHLPATAALAPLTPVLVSRALVLNGIAGLVFGWLFLRHGLESAMLAHAAAHLVLQLPGVWIMHAL